MLTARRWPAVGLNISNPLNIKSVLYFFFCQFFIISFDIDSTTAIMQLFYIGDFAFCCDVFRSAIDPDSTLYADLSRTEVDFILLHLSFKVSVL
jgi:hypothetical protein